MVDKETVSGTLKEIILTAGGPLLKEVHVFDLYEGDTDGRRQKIDCVLIEICGS